MYPELDALMTEVIGADWFDKVQDSNWKPTEEQLGKQFSRMFVAKLSSGGVLIYSPTNIKAPGVLEAVKSMGEVTAIICPNDNHYMHAYPWQLEFPNAYVYAPKNFGKRKKCTYASGPLAGTWVNPMACAIGGEAPIELGWTLGPRSLFSNGGPVANQWSRFTSPSFLDTWSSLPTEISDDFEVITWQGDSMSHELLFYHKKSKSLFVADWLYVGQQFSLKDEWSWSPEAKIFSYVFGHASASPALPNYRGLRSGLSGAGLMMLFSTTADRSSDAIQQLVDKDRESWLLGKLSKASGYYQDWEQMNSVVQHVLSLDLGKVLICHAAGFPEGEHAKELIRKTWGFIAE
jgi:hypothetical protein